MQAGAAVRRAGLQPSCLECCAQAAASNGLEGAGGKRGGAMAGGVTSGRCVMRLLHLAPSSSHTLAQHESAQLPFFETLMG